MYHYANPTEWNFRCWRREAGLSIDDCVRLFKVSKRTVNRWDKEIKKPPQAVILCLQIFSSRLDFMGKGWKGFRLLPDCIEAPNGDFIYHYEAASI